MSKRVCAAIALLITGAALCCGTQDACSETAYVYGKRGWFSGGDIIQFIGDSGYNNMFAPHCAAWDGGCLIDRGFAFRKVHNVDEEDCTFESASDTCCACAVVCCYWGGGCEGDISRVCGVDGCWSTEEECGGNCYCLSLWEVVGFNVAPGDQQGGAGCYALDLVCDPDDEDCLPIAGVCDTMLLWWLP